MRNAARDDFVRPVVGLRLMKPKSIYEIALILAATFGFMAAVSVVGLFLFHRSGIEGASATGRVFHGSGWILCALIVMGVAAVVLLISKRRGGSNPR